MKRLAAMQVWPVLILRALTATLAAALIQVGVRQDDEGVRPAQLQHGLLDRPTRRGGHVAAGGVAARQVTAAMRGSPTSVSAVLPEISRFWKTPAGKPALEYLLDGDGAAAARSRRA